MKAKKVMALVLCAAMVSGLAATTVMAAPEDQFDGLTANEAYEFPMMVKSFQSTYWEAAMKGMDKAAEELGVTYTAQGPNSESDIADQVNMINTAIAANPVGLGLAACDTSSVQAALQTCADKGIPVVTLPSHMMMIRSLIRRISVISEEIIIMDFPSAASLLINL